MAKYGSQNVTISFDNAGGTPVDMTAYITDMSEVAKDANVEDATVYGNSWEQSLAVGVNKVGDITITGFYDDTATTGPDVIFNAIGNTTTRTLTVTWGGAKTTSVETIISSYKRLAKVKALTKYTAVLRPTGAVTEA